MILRRYMIAQVATTTTVVLLFLMVLMLGGRLIRYFGMVAEGQLNIGFLFNLMIYNLPSFLELILPLSFFVALMLVLGRMYVEHEMSVLFSSGQSRGRITGLMLPLILLLFLLEAGISLWAKPYGVAKTEKIWQTQSLNNAFDLVKPKTFINSGNYHVYVDSMDKNTRTLNDIYIVQKAPKTATKDVIITAKQAKQSLGYANDSFTRLVLLSGKRYEIDTDNRIYNQTHFERYQISIAKPNRADQQTENVIAQSTKQLLANWQKSTVQAELGYRFSLPFLIVIASMLATPLAQVEPRQGRWLRLLPAILVFVAVAVSVISLKTGVSKQKFSVAAYAWFVIAVMLLCLWLNWQQRIVYRLRHRMPISAKV
ncbi:permease YjgP/YjgQ [Moraxella macacae 0408225]|uniref:Lipopolysaccharide export system permease protein LptF n=1 Tax=Moraxella macacae 0408225 TaxID=1230338 RepID=L2F9Q2_9GAMM|nr:LPS export ABC transporter permease LptF [Moraxella macacae]ELA09496.1 permease YjgP/YjgQ [Moraxella macacae 0408225]